MDRLKNKTEEHPDKYKVIYLGVNDQDITEPLSFQEATQLACSLQADISLEYDHIQSEEFYIVVPCHASKPPINTPKTGTPKQN